MDAPPFAPDYDLIVQRPTASPVDAYLPFLLVLAVIL